MTYWDDVLIFLKLRLDEQWNPVWNLFTQVFYKQYLYVKPNQEYSIRLKELTGYTEPVQTSPNAKYSHISISINDNSIYRYILKAQPIPKSMRAGWEFDAFSLDPKDETIEDLGVTFSFNSPPNTRNEILLALEIAAFIMLLIFFSILITRITTREERTYFKMQHKLKR